MSGRLHPSSWLCAEQAPTVETGMNGYRCSRNQGHTGVHAAWVNGRCADAWPRFQDVVALRRENGTL